MSAAKKASGFNATASIALLRLIAAEAGEAMLTEGYVQPDHELLDMCAIALHHLTHAQRTYESRDSIATWPDRHSDPAGHAAVFKKDAALMESYYAEQQAGKNHLYWIAKKKATTAAGIYAKAMVVSAPKTGAAGLAMSLAADLIACEEP